MAGAPSGSRGTFHLLMMISDCGNTGRSKNQTNYGAVGNVNAAWEGKGWGELLLDGGERGSFYTGGSWGLLLLSPLLATDMVIGGA